MQVFVQKLQLNHFRNFSQLEVRFEPGCNLVIGPNGSGKTTILEALYFLSYGRSFRANQLDKMTQAEAAGFVLFSEVCHDKFVRKLAVSRTASGDNQQKIDGKPVRNSAEFAENLPCLMLGPESFKLFTDGGKARRQWLDWGVFYAESQFIQSWRQYSRLLQQRNAGLKQNLPYSHIAPWDENLVIYAQCIDEMRKTYVKKWREVVRAIDPAFFEDHGIEMQYYRGWSKEQDLAELLQVNFQQDKQNGFTSCGPHRADVRFRIGRIVANDILSRGQQKRLIVLLKLAQGQLYQQCADQACIYLIDDLYSELDEQNAETLLQHLEQQQAQSILTCISEKDITTSLLNAPRKVLEQRELLSS